LYLPISPACAAAGFTSRKKDCRASTGFGKAHHAALCRYTVQRRVSSVTIQRGRNPTPYDLAIQKRDDNGLDGSGLRIIDKTVATKASLSLL